MTSMSMFGRQFALAPTLGKVLNSTSESSHCIDELAETYLKSYTSADRMTFQRKYKEPIHTHPTAKVMISTNQLPQFTDKSIGIWRRMLFVPFEKKYPEDKQNHNLIDQLSMELPGIFNWAFEGLKKLRQAGNFTRPTKCRQAVEQYRMDVNPARAFLQQNYVASLQYEGLPCQEVYRSYTHFCERNGFRPMNNTNFGKEVKRVLPAVKKEQKRFGRGRTTFYLGLAVKEDSEVAAETVYTDYTDYTKF
ncbi:MAG: hypothetical protein JXB29_04290 [Sedimentisphaerales bacterium]|nr:hypothetical protein [Sedimentisphaerales bacterium]